MSTAGAPASARREPRMYAAFLRGINVGGHKVKGDEVRTAFEKLGFEEVATFRASGNVVLNAAAEPLTRMAGRIEQALKEDLGYEVPVFLRTAGEVQAIAEHQPFPPALVEASNGKLQVSLFGKAPARGAREQVLSLATDEDRLAFGDRELYWLPSGGIKESNLDLKRIEGLLGVTTMRTKGTLEQLAAKYFSA